MAKKNGKGASSKALEMNIEWRSCGSTTVGTVRNHNEDSYTAMPDKRLWVVADGMGGHEHGDFASQSITSAFDGFEPSATLSETIDGIEARVLGVNKMLRDKTGGSSDKMIGSTVVLLYAYSNYMFLMWAGDSRAYILRQGKLRQISRDHSYVQEIVDKGLLSPEDAATHPSGNIITRAVGVADTLFLDMDVFRVEYGDKFLICSDGLFKDITDDDIAGMMKDIPMRAVEGLIEKALANGADDNVTVIVVEAHKGS